MNRNVLYMVIAARRWSPRGTGCVLNFLGPRLPAAMKLLAEEQQKEKDAGDKIEE